MCSKDNIVVNDNFTLNGDIINKYSSIQHLGRDVGDSDSNCKAINKAIGELYMIAYIYTSKILSNILHNENIEVYFVNHINNEVIK